MAKKQKKRVRPPTSHFARIPVKDVKLMAVVDGKTTVERKRGQDTARTGGSHGN